MKSWAMAMVALNDLIEGKPQRVQSGALLLALSAWHLYPDISVQSTSSHFVKQADPLVDQGGIITVGLHNDMKHADEGVYWSLPLAHLRVYGKPVVTTRHNGIDQTQVSFAQLLCLALGSMFSTWHVAEADSDAATEVVSLLAEADLEAADGDGVLRVERSQIAWLRMMGRAAKTYLTSEGSVRDEYARLIAYGRRRCGGFLGDEKSHLPPFFGLAHVPTAFRLFAPCHDPRKRSKPGTVTERRVDFLRQWANNSRLNFSRAIILYMPDIYGIPTCTNVCVNRAGTKRKSSREEVPSFNSFKHWKATTDDDFEMSSEEEGTLYLSPGLGEQPVLCKFVYGDPGTAAIYRPSRERHQTKPEHGDIRPKSLLHLCRDGAFRMDLVLRYIVSLDISTHAPCIESLKALEAAERIYEHLVDAKVDLRICQKSLHASLYSRHLQAQRSEVISKEQSRSEKMIVSLKTAFSCIAIFQTGHIDIEPENLEGAMAISHGDSIFVAQNILLDPSETDTSCPVKRIIGNVGKAGLVILIPPQTPEMREKAPSDWRVVNHTPFDGKYENNFASTSLHLAFTGYELPIDVRERGSLNHEAHFVETVISVYECGEWVADLDILKALLDYKYGWSENAKSTKEKIKIPLVSVDNWHEVLDNPQSNAIVRACGNKHARLAIATVASQLGYNFRIICPDDHLSYEPGHFQSPEPNPSHQAREAGEKSRALDDPEVLIAMANCDPLDVDYHEESESDQSLDMTDMSPEPDAAEPDDVSVVSSESASVYDPDDVRSDIDGVLYIC
jgi:hypothetical protein